VAQPYAIIFMPDASPLPDAVEGWLGTHGIRLVRVANAREMMSLALRGRPLFAVFDARSDGCRTLQACRLLKGDSFTGVIPACILARDGVESLAAAFDASADEVVTDTMGEQELRLRLDTMVRRAERDVQVHPSTRLSGAPAIEGEISRRLEAGELFAVCYADLDHFKEYNDRYSYYEGDRVIRILAKILHDVVRGISPNDGFVGHIGGDDFIFIVSVPAFPSTCEEIVAIFDSLVPYQYSEQDRRAGYFFGKDRRGRLHRVPLMTVSIGVVTNERRRFTHPGQVSALATEMKTYAKTLPGSVFATDRRTDADDDPNAAGGGSPA
jgi:GGDEF domain-containing protein